MTSPHPHPDQGAQTAGLPSNLDAEMALLGALLYDNAAFERISDSLNPGHFFEPFHGRVFAAIVDLIRKGQLAEPVVIMERFRGDPAFEELGGLRYLADLVDDAPPSFNAPDYARVIESLALRRNLIGVAEFVRDGALRDFGTEPKEMLEAAESALFALAETGQREAGFVDLETALDGALDVAAQAFDRNGDVAGLSTGLIDLDQRLGGLHPTNLLILAGRPSMGKTALATNIAFHVARAYAFEDQPDGSRKTVRGGRVGFFSLEMSADELGLRLLAEVSGVSGDRIRKGDIDQSEFSRLRDARDEIRSAPLKIDATGGLSIAKLCARARRLKRRMGLDLIVVDYLQLVTTGERDGRRSRVEQISEITQGLKALAKELNVPVLALSQLSRQVESRDDKRPQLSDLRESGSIEQDADAVMFVFRESYYLSRSEPREGTSEHLTWAEQMSACQGLAEVIIGKQRHGPIGTVRLHFDEDRTKFGNLAREDRYPAREPRDRGPAPATPRHAQTSARLPYGGDQ